MKLHYNEVVKACDNAVERYLEMTVQDKDSMDFGGVKGVDTLVAPGTGIGCLLSYASVYYNKDSRFYKNTCILEAMENALTFTENIQRENGTFDLLISNFFSAPDTGFIMHNMGRSYKILNKFGETDREKAITERLFKTIKKASIGLRDGGFHTPNHRWVVAAGLAMAGNIIGDPSLMEMAEKYLAEGIDIDENGEFTEKSPGIYNCVNDNALIILAEELGKPELMQHAFKNLEMMLHYIEPDGSVFTQNSVRVDKGEGMPGQSFYPTNYYYLYLQAAYLSDNPVFAKMAELIYQSALRSDKGVPGAVWLYMLEENLRDFVPEQSELSNEYEVFYKPSGIVRRRKKDLMVTLLANSPNFLFIQKGHLRCYVRMCASFFAVAQFKPKEIIETDDGYSMEFTAHGSYKMPFDNPPGTSVWDQMDHSKRDYVSKVDLSFYVDVEFTDDGLSMRVRTEGCDRVPFKLDFCLTGGSTIKSENFMVYGIPGNGIIAGKSMIVASLGTDYIEFGPGFMEHGYAADMRGSQPVDQSSFTVHFTTYTNVNKTIEFKTGKGLK